MAGVSSDGGSTKLKAYKMKSPHGIALIISNIKFNSGTLLAYRAGADADEVNLLELFNLLNYKVVFLRNLTGKEINMALQVASGYEGMTFEKLDKDYKEHLMTLSVGDNLIQADHDSFVCCLLSHGTTGLIYGIDGVTFNLNNIYEYLGSCVHLSGKPKMVFIQASQSGGAGSHFISLPQSFEKNSRDFLMSFAAFYGQKSFIWTSGGKGSWYINALCRIFKDKYKEKDVLSMITEVHREVMDLTAKSQVGDNCYQCPRLEHTLKYDVKLAVKVDWRKWFGSTTYSPPLPPPPIGLKIDGVSSTSVAISWLPLDGPVRTYQVSYTADDGNEQIHDVRDMTHTELTSLEPETGYTICVRAKTREYGEWSTSIKIYTLRNENVTEKVSKILNSFKDITFKQLRILKLIFYGTPRAGKTTLKEQLLRHVKGVPLLPRGSMQQSTYIAHRSEPIFVERVILTDEESNEWKWSVQELDDIAKALLHCMNNEQLQCEPGISHSQTSINESAATDNEPSLVSKDDGMQQKTQVEQQEDAKIVEYHQMKPSQFKTALKEDIPQMEHTQMIDHKRPILNVEDIKRMFQNAVKTSNWAEVVRALDIDKAMFLQFIDCGGQPSFQEIFPLLISGPSVAIIIFKLTDNFEMKHSVLYQPQPGNTGSKTWNDSYIVKDIISHALSSFVPQSAQETPVLLLVGTHKDKLKNPLDKLSNIAEQLNGWLCKSKPFGCIQVTKMYDLITGIDNFNEEDIKLIRKRIEKLISQLDTQDIPAPWLVFDFVLHKYAQENKLCKVQINDCKDLAKHCGVDTDIEAVLHYLHNNAGTLLYYSDIPKLNEYVITDFQLIIDSISKIIVEYFDESSECHKKYKDQLHQQGRLDESVLKDVKDCLKKDELLTLLHYRHIISKIEGTSMYFMPSVLPKADKLPTNLLNDKLLSNSFLVLFGDNGYCPVGLFCATTTSLIGVKNTPDYECEWKVNDHEQQFRDKIHFSFICSENSYNVIFSAFPTHFEVCLKEPTEGLAEVMPKIKQMIYQNISDIIMKLCTDLHYPPPSYGFYCSYKHEGTEIQHPARCPFTEKCQQMKCVQNGNESSLTNEHKEWFLVQFTKASNPESLGKPSVKVLMVFPSVVKGVKKNIDIIQKTCTSYSKLGMFLLDDENGDIVDALKEKCHHDPVEITKAVYKKWIDGTGRKPVAWKTLVDVLREIELNGVADDIDAVNH